MMTSSGDHEVDGDGGELFGVHIPELQLDEREVEAALDAAGLMPGERYVELGCGHGRGLVAAAQRGAVAVGVDYVEDALAHAHTRARRAGVDVTLLRDDLQRIDLSDADVVHMHLGPAFHDRLAAQLERQLAPTARVIAAGWRVPGWLALRDAAAQWERGWIYRPGDARQHGIWIDAADAGVDPGPDALPGELREVCITTQHGRSEVVAFRAGVDLVDVRVRVSCGEHDEPAALTASCSARTLGRGQAMLIRLERTQSSGYAGDGDVRDVTVTIEACRRHARSASAQTCGRALRCILHA